MPKPGHTNQYREVFGKEGKSQAGKWELNTLGLAGAMLIFFPVGFAGPKLWEEVYLIQQPGMNY